MINQKKEFTTYKFYDKRGRRLSIFATVVDDFLIMSVFTCNNDDTFSKEKARQLYKLSKIEGLNLIRKELGLNPEIITTRLDVKSDKSPHQQFIDFCRNKYSWLQEVKLTLTLEVLKGREEISKEEVTELINKAND